MTTITAAAKAGQYQGSWIGSVGTHDRVNGTLACDAEQT